MHIIQSRINLLLEERDEPQKWLAKRAGVTEATISRICKGISLPGGDVLAQIADAFDVSADYILGRTVDRRVSSRRDEVEYLIGKTYQRLSDHDRMIVLAVMRDYLRDDEAQLLAGDMAGRMKPETMRTEAKDDGKGQGE